MRFRSPFPAPSPGGPIPEAKLDREKSPADVLINVTNDGWFGNSTGPHQHLAQLRLRAIEQGLPAARAANTGISAIVDAYGRIESSLPIGASGVVVGGLPVALPATIYARLGDWIIAAAISFGLIMGLAARFSTKQSI